MATIFLLLKNLKTHSTIWQPETGDVGAALN